MLARSRRHLHQRPCPTTGWSLTFKLTFSMTAMIMLVVLSISVLFVRHQQHTFHAELEQQAMLLLDSLSAAAADPLYALDTDALSDMMLALGEDRIVVSGHVYDKAGRIVASAYDSRERFRLAADPFAQRLVTSDTTVFDWQPEQVVAGQAITVGRQRLGALSIGLSTAPLQAKLAATRTQSVMIACVAVACGIVLTRLVSQTITIPLRDLTAATQHIANGDLSQTVAVRSRDEVGTLATAFNQMVTTLRDNHAVRAAFEDQLTHQAFHDSLSDLPNRALFMERLRDALDAADEGHHVAVLFLDLDNFKVVNDSLGHQVGDQLLVAIAARLRDSIRANDLLARLGGDEFTILLDHLPDIDTALDVAERIQTALRAPIALNGHDVVTTVSIGVALRMPGHDQPVSLLRAADLAMYHAKASGKALYALFEPSMDTRAQERLALETDLRRALERDELRVYYQPIVQLGTGAIIGMEALVRWEHPQRGLLAPGEFIPLAEETGLIVQLGQWVLATACAQKRAWQDEFPHTVQHVININLSTRQFHDQHLLTHLTDVLHTTGLHAQQVQLEITESLMQEDRNSTLHILRTLKKLGVQLAIDDFGTGYSSLSYLKHFPIDSLKIDRSFVNGLGHDGESTAIVRAVMAFAVALNLSVTAEGVETDMHIEQLRAVGCTRGQGYYFTRPLPAAAIHALLATPPTWQTYAAFCHTQLSPA